MDHSDPQHPGDRDISLCRLVGSGLSAEDVAAMLDVPVSAISPVWHRPDWLDCCDAPTLRALMATFDPVAQHVVRRLGRRRLDRSWDRAQQVGLAVNDAALPLLRETVGNSAIAAVIDAAVHLRQGRFPEAYRWLGQCWGVRGDVVVDALLDCGPARLFLDCDSVVTAAAAAVHAGRPESGEMTDVVGHSILVHKGIRNGWLDVATPLSAEGIDPFEFRSRVIGTLFSTEDADLVKFYGSRVAAQPDLARSEVLSLSTFSGDLGVAAAWGSPSAIPALERTATDVLSDLGTRADAYVYYLLEVAIPQLLRTDPTFGGRAAALWSRLCAIRHRDSLTMRTRSAADLLATRLRDDSIERLL
ncbi:hypothetical protein [Williamsia sp. CHRR-6]|uniref:hypothetical protein n=1 Tax=Williamsia sp. CHRR-6 TaxID=2835871 RepID=UPI001BD9D843|nr:hypothetical protein [Williamsia sp. CHRR-6]MBT0567419.1 hypothetical protein [Williamsia sp. CHRR-6]